MRYPSGVTPRSRSRCADQDFRHSMLFYCVVNNLVYDGTGEGVEDVRTNMLRVAASKEMPEGLDAWVENDVPLGAVERVWEGSVVFRSSLLANQFRTVRQTSSKTNVTTTSYELLTIRCTHTLDI